MSWLRKSFGVMGVAVSCGLFAPGCEKNESMVFILGVLAIDRTDCTAKPESSAVLLAGGTLDLSVRNSYTAALLVGSQLTQRGSRERIRTETARLSLEGAEIRLENTAGVPLPGISPNPYSTFGTGFVNPSSGTEAGFGTIFADLIPASVRVPSGSTVVARVRAFGTTLGGQEIESNDFLFPIQVCNGCLVQYPEGSIDESADPGQQLCTKFVETDSESGACFPGQDGPVNCSICAGSSAACLVPCQNCERRLNFGCMGPAPEQCQ